MPLQLPKPVVSEDQKMKLMLFAPAGVGKTTLAGTAVNHPKMSPVLYANLEGGLLSVVNQPGIFEVPIRTSVELEELYWALREKRPGFENFSTVVIDSGTTYARKVLTEWVDINSDRATRRGKGDPDRRLDDIQLEDYGKMSAQVLRVLSWFYELPMHVIVTALERKILPKAPQGVDASQLPPTSIQADFTERLGDKVMGLPDHVWYLYVGDDERRYMLTSPSGVYRVKTRNAKFREAIGNPTATLDLSILYQTLIDSTQNGADGADSDSEG